MAAIVRSVTAVVRSVTAVVRASCVIGSEIADSPSLGGRALVDIPATGRYGLPNVVQIACPGPPKVRAVFLFVLNGRSFQLTDGDMNPQDILRYVDSLHREKNIEKE